MYINNSNKIFNFYFQRVCVCVCVCVCVWQWYAFNETCKILFKLETAGICTSQMNQLSPALPSVCQKYHAKVSRATTPCCTKR
jgi:hypothetical protein